METGGEGEGKGLSAAGARRVNRRVAKQRLIEPASQYTVYEKGPQGAVAKTYTGTLKVVMELCPKIKSGTLKRRLDNGERDLVQLRRAPETKLGARMRRINASHVQNRKDKKNV